MKSTPARHASWQDLLGSPERPAHIVQIYESDDFLVAGVALFAAEGLRRGEAVLLTGTPAHLDGVRRGLRSRGIDAEAAIARRELSLFDVRAAIDAVMVDGKADAARFETGTVEVLARAAADSRFTGVRWWGEISNVLNQQGNAEAALACERLANSAIARHGLTVLCSYLGDNFDPAAYDGILPPLCAAHTHFIPAQDYVHHRLTVNRAIADVIGDIKGPLLQSLLSWKALACDVPSSQAVLFWLREAMPERFNAVLSRAKTYHSDQTAAD